MSSIVLRTLFLVALGASALACNGKVSDSSSDGTAQDLTAASASGVIKLGVTTTGTFQSETATKTLTFAAQKGWKLSVEMATQGCGPQLPHSPGCEPPFVAHFTLKQGADVILDETGDKVSGNADANFTAPEDGTYTLVAGVSSRNGTSPLKYGIDVSPPNIACKTSDDCQVHIDGRTIETGLECVHSACISHAA
jgi:hypothetical protein